MQESFRPGDIVLLEFPFTDAVGGSRCPALVLIDAGDNDVVTARITRQPRRDQFDIGVIDLGSAGLRYPSVARTHKLTTTSKSLIERKLGALSEADWGRVRGSIMRLWARPNITGNREP